MRLPDGAWYRDDNPIHEKRHYVRQSGQKPEPRYGTCGTCKCELNKIEFERKQNNCDLCEEGKK